MIACEDCKHIYEIDGRYSCSHKSCFAQILDYDALTGARYRSDRNRDYIDKNRNGLCKDFEKLTTWDRIGRCF